MATSNVSSSSAKHKGQRIYALLTFTEGDDDTQRMEIFCVGASHSSAFNVALGQYHQLHGMLDLEYEDAPGLKWIFSLTPEQ